MKLKLYQIILLLLFLIFFASGVYAVVKKLGWITFFAGLFSAKLATSFYQSIKSEKKDRERKNGEDEYLMDNTDRLKVIGFDADDTLWVNEPYYRESEDRFCELLQKFGDKEFILKKLLEIEVKNLGVYGYGTKAFMLSLIETALLVSENRIRPETIGEIIVLGKSQINRPNEILPGAEKVLKELSGKYRLILATKGDLLDQERKLSNSGLPGYFHHIEIMSDKKTENYRQLLKHLDILPSEFLMVGNSMKSDILPVLELGGNAIHIPFHTTWIFEDVIGTNLDESRFMEVESIEKILKIL